MKIAVFGLGYVGTVTAAGLASQGHEVWGVDVDPVKVDLLNQGAVSLIIAWDDSTQQALAEGTLFKRAKMYIPEMGLPGGGDSVGIPKNAPHKAAALLFIDFLTSPEMQLEMNSMVGSYHARTDVATENALLPEEQRQKNGLSWYPAPYKAHGNEMFTQEVLMK